MLSSIEYIDVITDLSSSNSGSGLNPIPEQWSDSAQCHHHWSSQALDSASNEAKCDYLRYPSPNGWYSKAAQLSQVHDSHILSTHTLEVKHYYPCGICHSTVCYDCYKVLPK